MSTENRQRKAECSGERRFYFLSSLACVLITILSWKNCPQKKIGLLDIVQLFYETAREKLSNDGLSTFSFAFFIYSVFKSGIIQKFFYRWQNYLSRNKYFSVFFMTFLSGFLSTNLSWFDEFIHFYPIIVPFFEGVGFDSTSSILCLYGGSISGMISVISSERMDNYFKSCLGDKIKISNQIDGNSGIIFRLVTFFVFLSFTVFFNIWTSHKRFSPNNERKKKEFSSKFEEIKVTKRDKFNLLVVSFFLLISIISQFSFFSNLIKEKKFNDLVPEELVGTSSIEIHEKVGRIGNEMNISKVDERKLSRWNVFGSWEAQSIDCFLIIGGIIICMISNLDIPSTLVLSIRNSISLLVVYFFALTPVKIMKESGLTDKLTRMILPDTTVSKWTRITLLAAVYFFSSVFSFFFSSTSISMAFISALSKVFLSFSKKNLIDASLFSWMGSMIGSSYSPNNGILIETLEKNALSYNKFIKVVWKFAIFLFIFGLFWVVFWSMLLKNTNF